MNNDEQRNYRLMMTDVQCANIKYLMETYIVFPRFFQIIPILNPALRYVRQGTVWTVQRSSAALSQVTIMSDFGLEQRDLARSRD